MKASASVGLSASIAITGSYQVRARRIDADTIELSYLRESGMTLIADISASARITAKLGDTDLVASILGAISTDPVGDKSLLAGLQPPEVKTLSDAVHRALDGDLTGLTSMVDDVQQGGILTEGVKMVNSIPRNRPSHCSATFWCV